ncbi:MAG: hypothetical protein EOP51_16660 [Sphingobacteriales bacterium]|nr:MAG: hypothetical protein EOP51_16660 [Sphingobacteriales bacterium]
MKKYFLIAGLCAGLSLSSCGGSKKDSTNEDTTNAVADTTGIGANVGMDTLNGGNGDTIMKTKSTDGAISTGAGENTGGTPNAGGETNQQSATPPDVGNSNTNDQK